MFSRFSNFLKKPPPPTTTTTPTFENELQQNRNQRDKYQKLVNELVIGDIFTFKDKLRYAQQCIDEFSCDRYYKLFLYELDAMYKDYYVSTSLLKTYYSESFNKFRSDDSYKVQDKDYMQNHRRKSIIENLEKYNQAILNTKLTNAQILMGYYYRYNLNTNSLDIENIFDYKKIIKSKSESIEYREQSYSYYTGTTTYKSDILTENQINEIERNNIISNIEEHIKTVENPQQKSMGLRTFKNNSNEGNNEKPETKKKTQITETDIKIEKLLRIKNMDISKFEKVINLFSRIRFYWDSYEAWKQTNEYQTIMTQIAEDMKNYDLNIHKKNVNEQFGDVDSPCTKVVMKIPKNPYEPFIRWGDTSYDDAQSMKDSERLYEKDNEIKCVNKNTGKVFHGEEYSEQDIEKNYEYKWVPKPKSAGGKSRRAKKSRRKSLKKRRKTRRHTK